jgi:alcohol dehydrogenase class IV
VRGFFPVDYPKKKPLVPHGMSTALGAPAAFQFTAHAKPERHIEIAGWMGVKPRSAGADAAGQALREAFIAFMQSIGLPNGLQAVGYTSSDLASLAEGTMKQKRLLGLSPEPVTVGAVERMLEESLVVW